MKMKTCILALAGVMALSASTAMANTISLSLFTSAPQTAAGTYDYNGVAPGGVSSVYAWVFKVFLTRESQLTTSQPATFTLVDFSGFTNVYAGPGSDFRATYAPTVDGIGTNFAMTGSLYTNLATEYPGITNASGLVDTSAPNVKGVYTGLDGFSIGAPPTDPDPVYIGTLTLYSSIQYSGASGALKKLSTLSRDQNDVGDPITTANNSPFGPAVNPNADTYFAPIPAALWGGMGLLGLIGGLRLRKRVQVAL